MTTNAVHPIHSPVLPHQASRCHKLYKCQPCSNLETSPRWSNLSHGAHGASDDVQGLDAARGPCQSGVTRSTHATSLWFLVKGGRDAVVFWCGVACVLCQTPQAKPNSRHRGRDSRGRAGGRVFRKFADMSLHERPLTSQLGRDRPKTRDATCTSFVETLSVSNCGMPR